MLDGSVSSILLRGNTVLPDGVALDRYILVRNGRIAAISRRRPPLTEDIPYVQTERTDWIFPGLLDLHTHSVYNILPLWRSPNAPFDNRFEWRADAGYRSEVREVHKKINKGHNRKVIGLFGELQAVAGGTVVLQESVDLDRDKGSSDRLLLCRDTASATDLGLPSTKRILSVVDLFKPDKTTGEPAPVERSLNRYEKLRVEKKLIATLVHLAEGRSGFGSNRNFDAYSRREFEAFMDHPIMEDAGLVRETPLALIHGCGIDPHNREHIRFLRERNISIIWSPVSNWMLYGDTIDVETLLSEGINVALGSDWSPSGSKHVWDEAKFARFYFDAIGSPVTDETIFQMVTTNAGKCLGIPQLGRITVGAFADFLVLRSPLETDNPHEIFLGTLDRQVLATTIGGRPVYGDRKFLKQFSGRLQPLPVLEGSAVSNKAVHLPPGVKLDVDRDIARIESELKELDPPVKRSNLLVSSDKQYRRRVHMMRSRVERFGWSVQEWRHAGPAVDPGAVAVSPASVRVWRGFRNNKMKWEDFRAKLGSVLLPAAVNLQGPLGLTAYFPALLPEDKPDVIPDEIALLFFESQSVYRDALKTVAGRAFGLLRASMFDRAGSRSGFPKKLGDKLVAGRPVYVIDRPTDWYGGLARIFVGRRPQEQSTDQFLTQAYEVVSPLKNAAPQGLDGIILDPEAEYLIYWEHWSERSTAGDEFAAPIASVAEQCMAATAKPTNVPPHIYWRSVGSEFNGGDFLNLQFERRALFPW